MDASAHPPRSRRGRLLAANRREGPEDMRVIPQPALTEALPGGLPQMAPGEGELKSPIKTGAWGLAEITVPAGEFTLIHVVSTHQTSGS